MNATQMKPEKVTLTRGLGWWRTDRYPIGGEFHRFDTDIEVMLTGKKIDFGQYFGYEEFTLVIDGKQATGYCRPIHKP